MKRIENETKKSTEFDSWKRYVDLVILCIHLVCFFLKFDPVSLS